MTRGIGISCAAWRVEVTFGSVRRLCVCKVQTDVSLEAVIPFLGAGGSLAGDRGSDISGS